MNPILNYQLSIVNAKCAQSQICSGKQARRYLGGLVVGRKKEGKKKEEEEEGHHILNISRAEDKIIIQAIECNYVI